MNWKLTQQAIGKPEIDVYHEDPDEDLAVGFSLLRALAEDPDNGLTEISPGRYWHRKGTQIPPGGNGTMEE